MTNKQAAKYCKMSLQAFKQKVNLGEGPKYAQIPYTRPSKKLMLDDNGDTLIEEVTVNMGSFTRSFAQDDLDTWLQRKKDAKSN